MKFAYLLTAAVAVGCLATSTFADDAAAKKEASHEPSGTWVWDTEVGQDIIESQVKLSLRDNKLTGQYSDQNVDLDIENGAFDGKTVTFDLNFDVDGTEVKVKFSGMVTDDKITGKVSGTVGGQPIDVDVDGKRRTGRRDVVGTWNLIVETESGEVFDPTLTLKLKRGRLTGSFSGAAAGEHDVQSATVRRNKLTFSVSGDTADGSSKFTAKISATPRGDRLEDGTVELELDGEPVKASLKGTRVVKKK